MCISWFISVKLLVALPSVFQEYSFFENKDSHNGEDIHDGLLVKIQTFFFCPLINVLKSTIYKISIQ